VEYYLRWCWALLTTYGKLLQGSDSMSHQESLRALIRAISIHETEILKMSDDNHFTLSFLTSQCGMDISGTDTETVGEISGDKAENISGLKVVVSKKQVERGLDNDDEDISSDSDDDENVVSFVPVQDNAGGFVEEGVRSEEEEEEVIVVTKQNKFKKRKCLEQEEGGGEEKSHGASAKKVSKKLRAVATATGDREPTTGKTSLKKIRRKI
jgi:hypothetical protein